MKEVLLRTEWIYSTSPDNLWLVADYVNVTVNTLVPLRIRLLAVVQ